MLSINEALSRNKESTALDFKSKFDVLSIGDWCEIVKDIVAMANTGGGIILVGVANDGSPSNENLDNIRKLDPAVVADKVFSYTGDQFSAFEIREVEKNQKLVVAILVGKVSNPLVFIKSGNYQTEAGKQKEAFSKGAVYFRHSAKSEPCTAADLRDFLRREIEQTKSFWLSGIRQVVEAPEGSKVVVHRMEPGDGVRISADPQAPAARLEEKEIFEIFPLDYYNLVALLRDRYKNFSENYEFWNLKRIVEDEPEYCYWRFLNPKNKKGGVKKVYSKSIITFFDRHYTRR